MKKGCRGSESERWTKKNKGTPLTYDRPDGRDDSAEGHFFGFRHKKVVVHFSRMTVSHLKKADLGNMTENSSKRRNKAPKKPAMNLARFLEVWLNVDVWKREYCEMCGSCRKKLYIGVHFDFVVPFEKTSGR